jgi:broad specificity phosphatase PhoE
MTKFLFVRHGQTQANAAGSWQGWTDYPLNARGRTQAEAVAARLAAERDAIAALYTSPLLRALQTAEVIGARIQLDPIVLEQLKEIHFGELEGTTVREMENQFPDLFTRWQDKTDMTFQWPGGEQRGEFFARASSARRKIHARHRGEKVVIVAHGGTIRACLADMLPDVLGDWWAYALDNAGLSRVWVGDQDARLIALNDTTHLLGEAGRSSG